jgi:hypothetical protein
VQLAELGEQRLELDAAVSGRVRLQTAQCLRELPLGADLASAPRLVPRDRHVHETLEEVALPGGRRAPRVLELLVRGEVLAGPNQLYPGPIRGLELLRLPPSADPTKGLSRDARARYPPAVATILLCGVDVYFRGKLEALLPGHHFVTTDSVDWPDLVIADISRVDPIDVADSYPEIPILGFGGHTDTAGLRRAHEAGFDQVLVKNALSERAAQVVDELIA